MKYPKDLIGNAYARVDEKSRIVIPTIFRNKSLQPSNPLLAMHDRFSIYLIPPEKYQEIYQNIPGDFFNPQRIAMMKTVQEVLIKAGYRITLPQTARGSLNIKPSDRILVTGNIEGLVLSKS